MEEEKKLEPWQKRAADEHELRKRDTESAIASREAARGEAERRLALMDAEVKGNAERWTAQNKLYATGIEIAKTNASLNERNVALNERIASALERIATKLDGNH